MQLPVSFSKIVETLGASFGIILQYLTFASTIFLIFYIWKKGKYLYLKIQKVFPERKHILREIKYSCSTAVIFGVVIFLVMLASKYRLTLIYYPIDKYGYVYYVFSIFLMVVIHDAYIYWTHRLLHWRPLFKKIHLVHHLSVNPTPFAAFAFHPVEAFVQIGILPLIAFTVPYHVSAITIFASYDFGMNILGHMGYEFFPNGFVSNKLLKFYNTPTNHNMHHRFINCNYGLYFNIWDRLMKTHSPRYEEIYDGVIAQRKQKEIIPAGNPTPFTTNGYLVGQKELMN